MEMIAKEGGEYYIFHYVLKTEQNFKTKTSKNEEKKKLKWNPNQCLCKGTGETRTMFLEKGEERYRNTLRNTPNCTSTS